MNWVKQKLILFLDQYQFSHIDESSFALEHPEDTEKEKAITRSRRMLLPLSPDYLSNRWKEDESSLIRYFGLEVGQYRAIPVLVRECEKLPARSSYLVSLDLTTQDEEVFKKLRDNLIPASDGRIDPTFTPSDEPRPERTGSGQDATEGLEALIRLMRVAAVRDAVANMSDRLESAHKQIKIVVDLKRLHDGLHNMQMDCCNQVDRDLKRFPEDPSAEGVVTDAVRTFRDQLEVVRAIVGESRPGDNDKQNIDFLDRSLKSFQEGLGENPNEVRRSAAEKALYWLKRVLNLYPSLINRDLLGAVHELELPELWPKMIDVRDCLKKEKRSVREIELFEKGVVSLARLAGDVDTLIEEHDRWQFVGTELRRIQNGWKEYPDELDLSWPDLKRRLEVVCVDSRQPKIRDVLDDCAKVDKAISAGKDAETKKWIFLRLRQSAGVRFHDVDTQLKKTREDLGKVGEPLAAVLNLLEDSATVPA